MRLHLLRHLQRISENESRTVCVIIHTHLYVIYWVTRYILAQILGAFIACLLIYAQYKVLIEDATAVLAKAGTLEALQFTPSGPAGAFALYLLPGQSLGRTFLNEFITVNIDGDAHEKYDVR